VLTAVAKPTVQSTEQMDCWHCHSVGNNVFPIGCIETKVEYLCGCCFGVISFGMCLLVFIELVSKLLKQFRAI